MTMKDKAQPQVKKHGESDKTPESLLSRIRSMCWTLTVLSIKGIVWLCCLAVVFRTGARYERNLHLEQGNSAESPEHTAPKLEVSSTHGPSAAPQLEVLAWRPRIFLARSFLSAEEARYIVNLVKEEMWDSGTDYNEEGQTGSSRTSTTGWLQKFEKTDKNVSAIIDRMHALALAPRNNGEPTSVARYKKGQLYGWHHDSNEIELRLATVLVYLQSPGAGGETIFPFANGGGGPAKPAPFDPSGGKGPTATTQFDQYCNAKRGVLKVQPRVGDAILFFSHLTSLKLDVAAWHASCPVTSGTKWVMQRWIKSIPFPKFVERKFNMSYAEWELLVAKADRVKQAKLKKAKAAAKAKAKKPEL
mmetsp:Transcript_64319/g.114294  ORF Transcript_64319/g.114294 Transcript_64319/m.114294 type:complete len:360 (-) Transcript_64319:58-1137(-)